MVMFFGVCKFQAARRPVKLGKIEINISEFLTVERAIETEIYILTARDEGSGYDWCKTR